MKKILLICVSVCVVYLVLCVCLCCVSVCVVCLSVCLFCLFICMSIYIAIVRSTSKLTSDLRCMNLKKKHKKIKHCFGSNLVTKMRMSQKGIVLWRGLRCILNIHCVWGLPFICERSLGAALANGLVLLFMLVL